MSAARCAEEEAAARSASRGITADILAALSGTRARGGGGGDVPPPLAAGGEGGDTATSLLASTADMLGRANPGPVPRG